MESSLGKITDFYFDDNYLYLIIHTKYNKQEKFIDKYKPIEINNHSNALVRQFIPDDFDKNIDYNNLTLQKRLFIDNLFCAEFNTDDKIYKQIFELVESNIEN